MKKYNLCYLDILKPLCFALLITFAGCRGSKVGENSNSLETKQQTEKSKIDNNKTTEKTNRVIDKEITSKNNNVAIKKEPVVFKRDSTNKATMVYFANGKYFDLYENDPYSNLNYPLLGKNQGFNVYDVKGKTVKDVLPNSNDKFLNPDFITTNTQMNTLSSYGSVYFGNNDSLFVVAKYELTAWTNEAVWAANATIYVMDLQGNILKKLIM